ncbi:MAG: M3 family oligoendopeptidase [Acholeplasmatales bacterium]|nr:M3 family oligoendopeptidase [Acholeplasmatales bacterium]
MRFEEYKYERPNFDDISQRLLEISTLLELSDDVNSIQNLIEEANKIKSTYSSMYMLALIRNSINTNDEFYDKEMEYLQENDTKVSSSDNVLTKTLVNHPLRSELEEIYGSYWFKKMEISLKTYDDSISDLLVRESKLVTEYNKLMASCQLEFKGEIRNLSQLRKYLSDTDRETRKAAAIKMNEFYKNNEESLDNIYDELVHIRHEMALKLGYNNFIELGYARMGRTDYNALDVTKYRSQVVEFLVPIVDEIIKTTAKNIGIDNPKFYDLGLEFLDGNPTPKGTKDELVAKALKMYTEMSEETKEFFNFMVDHNLLDLETKPGKQNGGYCTYLPDFNSPFIFSNFNGTSGDVDVLTHEAGHAFMAYSASQLVKNPDLCWPTNEASEIHSMSMEFFAYPWMDLFFEEDTLKYKISHSNGTLTFIPYGLCVDHFQHLVFENPNATPAERKEMWKRLEKIYTPWRDMEGLEMYEKGALWYGQIHIFQAPFYYIDYTLAQVCALEFYCDSIDNKKLAWDRYVSLCKLGGTKSFLELLESVGLHNPFNEGTIESIVNRLKPIISSYK